MKKLNTTLIYVLSSLSLLCCCFFGLGVLVALPSFLIANKKVKEAEQYSEEYEIDDVKSMKTAKTFAMIALIINGLYFIYSIYSWDEIMEQIYDALEQYQ